jgi:dienelactone hydrolase
MNGFPDENCNANFKETIRMKSIVFVFLLFATASYGQIEKLRAGPYRPGFISLTRYDASRPAVKQQELADKGRIIQVNCWFPSRTGGKRMHFADYVSLAGKELTPSLHDSAALQKGMTTYLAWPVSTGADKASLARFLFSKKPMAAFQSSQRIKAKRSLILLVHGFAADYAYMAEHLAAQGHFVLQVPVKGTTEYELDYEGGGLDTQVKDYEFALQVIQKEFGMTPDQLAIVGFSFGGQSAIALSLRQKHVKAVVSLDGGIGSTFGADLIRRQSYYNENSVKFPILHLYNPTDAYTELSWFNKVKETTRILVAMNRMQHGHFTSFGILDKIVPGIMGKGIDSPGNGYESVVQLTQLFLDEAFAGMKSPENFVDRTLDKFPWIKESIMKVETKLPGS